MDRQKDRYFKRNAVGVSTVEFFWGLGFPVVLESTFLQLFLKNLGASSFAVGVVPALFMVGISAFPLVSSYLSRNLLRRRGLVMALHLLSGTSMIVFGLTLLLVRQEGLVLPLFFGAYAVFSACLGLTIPIWLNYLVAIFPEARAVPGLGYMMLSQNLAKMISSLLILKVVDAYAFSLPSSAGVFIATGVLFLTGSFGFLITREVVQPEAPPRDLLSFAAHTRKNLREVFRNRNFMLFLGASDIEFVVIITSLSFYANYATRFYQVPDAIAAGLFVACIYGGSITVNIFLGAMNLLGLKQQLLLSKGITLAALLLLILVPAGPVFLVVSFLLGFVRATRNMVYPPSIKKFSGKADATAYFALAPILTLPFSVGYPLLFGKGVDLLAARGAGAYQLLFGLSVVLVLAALCCAIKTDYSASVEHNGSKR